ARPPAVPPGQGAGQVFRVGLPRPVANFGVVVLSSTGGSRFRPAPRGVAGGGGKPPPGDAGLPLAINPYLDSFGAARPVAGAIRPSAGSYDVVFDSPAVATPSGRGPGRYTFRFWVNDVMPPTVRLLPPVSRA